MTEKEMELARTFYDRMMVSVENIEDCDNIAVSCVRAAKAIGDAIQDETSKDLQEEKRLFEEARAAKQERKEQLKEKRENAAHYIVFNKKQGHYGIFYSAYIKSSTRDLDSFLTDLLPKKYEGGMLEVGVYRISKEDGDSLLRDYKKYNKPTSKYLECESSDDFLRYVGECASAERIDVTGYGIDNALVL